jgi:membrane-associated phospholipid phosphatase
VGSLDLWVFHLINGWSGYPLLDWIAGFADRIELLKAGILVSIYWWFWFSPISRDDRRRIVISALLGTIVALFVARALAGVLPFRARPIFTTGIDYHPPILRLQENLAAEDWSSFPSDHGAMWFALVYGLWRLSRPVGIAAAVFSTVWVCVVRIYLGVHYPSDVIAGAFIGLACGYVTPGMGGNRLADYALAYEKTHPQTFYALAFLATFEIAVIFDDVRVFMRGSLRALHGMGFTSIHLMEALVVGGAAVLLFVLTIGALVKWWRQPQS